MTDRQRLDRRAADGTRVTVVATGQGTELAVAQPDGRVATVRLGHELAVEVGNAVAGRRG